ncbi:tellurite resistance TerB family protein [Rhodovulum sp. DZ06]|uniref:tellurite resistance TerB family protein n=1 Tax=Rhodovulum sp. DZ06 TaxID=3425126 RepID=UPI003D353ED1
MPILNAQDALVAIMVTTSAADASVSEREMKSIKRIVGAMPAFDDYDHDRIGPIGSAMMDMLAEEDGLDAILGLVKEALPPHLNETAYAMACDVAAADGAVKLAELRFLEMVRHDLGVGRLAAAAIERGARARHQKLTPPANPAA